MFRQTVCETGLTSGIANEYFQSINGVNYDGDNSFVATLRALLANRIGDGYLNYRLSRHNASYSDLSKMSVNTVRGFFSGEESAIADCSNTISLYEISNMTSEGKELFTKKFAQAFPGYERLEKVTDFFQNAFFVLCFINPELKSVILITEQLGYQKYHYLQCATVAFFPWYFSASEGISEDEMALISSLREKTDEKYLSAIAKIAEQYNFREIFIKSKLLGFENRFADYEIRRSTNDIERFEADIENYYRSISDRLSRINELNIRILGLQAKKAGNSDDSELMEYFLSNKNLVLQDVSESELSFCVNGYLSAWDEEAAETYINNRSSIWYMTRESFTEKQIYRFLKAVFLDRKFKIRTCSAFIFDTQRASVTARSGYDFSHIQECKQSIANPHLYHFHCMGDNERICVEALRNQDYIFAFEQVIASNASLNFHDSPVTTRFAGDLFRSRRTLECIELPDGNIVSVARAIEILDNEERTEENGEDN